MDVLAVYSVKVAGAEDDTASYVSAFDEKNVRRLKAVFFDMTTVSTDVIRFFAPPGSGLESKETLYITVSGKTAEEAAEKYRFSQKQMELLMDSTGIKPMVNQVRCNPAIPNKKIIDFCIANEIIPLAHSPLNFSLSRGMKVEDPAYKAKLVSIGERYNKSCAQVILRFNYQNGVASVPGLFSPENQLANLSIFDFELSSEEMAELTQ